MKKLSILIVMVTMFACEKSLVTEETPLIAIDGVKSNTKAEDEIGNMVYNHIRLHSGSLSPYTYASTEQAKELKSAFDALKANPDVDMNALLTRSSKSARMSNLLSTSIQKYSEEGPKYFARLAQPNIKEIDSWFANQQNVTRNRVDITPDERNTLLMLQSVTKYAIKAYIESIPLPQGSQNARAAADEGCIQQISQCAVGNIFKYAGYGTTIAGAVGGGPGSIVGAIAGAIVSFDVCKCNQETPCSYPKAVTTPYVCYNPNAGINIRVLGYGDNANGFELEVWNNPDRQGAMLANPLQSSGTGNVFNLSDAIIQSNRVIYVRPVTNCNGDQKFAPEMVKFDLNELGKPNFQLTGPTTVSKGENATYSIIGYGVDTANWSIISYGATGTPVTSPGSTGNYSLYWGYNSGTAVLQVSGSSSCGTRTASIGVQVN